MEYLKPESFQLSVDRKGKKRDFSPNSFGEAKQVRSLPCCKTVRNFADSPRRVPKTAAGHSSPRCKPGREVYEGAEQKAPAFNMSSLFIQKESPEIINVILMA